MNPAFFAGFMVVVVMANANAQGRIGNPSSDPVGNMGVADLSIPTDNPARDVVDAYKNLQGAAANFASVQKQAEAQGGLKYHEGSDDRLTDDIKGMVQDKITDTAQDMHLTPKGAASVTKKIGDALTNSPVIKGAQVFLGGSILGNDDVTYWSAQQKYEAAQKAYNQAQLRLNLRSNTSSALIGTPLPPSSQPSLHAPLQRDSCAGFVPQCIGGAGRRVCTACGVQ